MKRILTLLAAITMTLTAMSQKEEQLPSWNDLADGKVYSVRGPGYYHSDISDYVFSFSSARPSTFTLDKYTKFLSITTIKKTEYERDLGDKQFVITMRMDTIRTMLAVDFHGQDLTVVKALDGDNAMQFNKLKIVKFEDGIGLEDSEHTKMWILEMPNKNEEN